MTDAEAQEWLTVSAKRLVEYPPEIVADACFDAQGECTHYSQITPKVVAYCKTAHAKQLRVQEQRDRWQSPIPALPKPEMDQEEFDRIVAERGLALSCALDEGRIVRTDSGFQRA